MRKHTRRSTWREIAWRPAVAAVCLIFTIIPALTWLRDEFLPPAIQEKWKLPKLLPHWPWWVWTIAGLSILILTIGESAYKLIHKHEDEAEKEKGQLNDEIAKLQAEIRQSTEAGGPDVILGYVDSGLGQGNRFLAARNLGPGTVYAVSTEISFHHFKAAFEPIAFIQSGSSSDVAFFYSPNNTSGIDALIEALGSCAEARDPNWKTTIEVTLILHNGQRKFEYLYDLECLPFYRKADFKFKRRRALGIA